MSDINVTVDTLDQYTVTVVDGENITVALQGVISQGGGSGPISTDQLAEGLTNLYYTDARVNTYVSNTTFSALSANTVTADSVTINGMPGPIVWNGDDNTLDIPLNGSTLQVGQEEVVYGKATEAIADGDVVMFAGSEGSHLLFAKADLNAPGFKDEWVLGLATETMALNDFGFVATFGKVRGIDTSAHLPGTILYLSDTTPGATTPTEPKHAITVAAVVIQHAVNGVLFSRPTFGKSHLHELHDVVLTTPATGEALVFNGTDWVNQPVTGSETDPVFTASPAGSIVAANITNWNTAYSWGDHATQGYLTSETLTSLTHNPVTTTLTYTDENGTANELDLSIYVDDTNLARLVSGNLDPITGIATFTRDDATTFTVDFSPLLADADTFITDLSFNTDDGVLTATRNDTGTVTVDLDNRYLQTVGFDDADVDLSDGFALLNGLTLDDIKTTVTTDGSTVQLNWFKNGFPGEAVRFAFSDGVYTLPAGSIPLTPGTDDNPVFNYVYLDQTDKTVKLSTDYFVSASTTEHARIAKVGLRSVADVAAHGPILYHAWTDHTKKSSGYGHIGDINYWIRHQPAVWEEGVALTISGSGTPTLDISTTAGEVLQLHDHDFPAFNTATGSHFHVINDFTEPYKVLTDLEAQTTDANGDSIIGSVYNIVIWGAVGEDDTGANLFVNMPNGSYSNNSGEQGTLDKDATAIYSIPQIYAGVGFLIARVTIQSAGGNFTVLQTQDLRGSFPGVGGAGGGAGGGVTFINDLADVDIATPATGQVITYNATTQVWENTAIPSTALNDVTDVTLTTPAEGDIVRYDANSATWINSNAVTQLETDMGDVSSALTAILGV